MTFEFTPRVHKRYLILLSVCALSLLLRIWLLDKRWIAPDEGAHLMDAVLVMDGKIPVVDFGSRMPIYVYANAAVLKLFGISYISGRMLPMTCSVLIGILVFFMALMLFDKRVAILSAAIYWMLPLELINSVLVQTEPLTIFLTCLSLCAVMLFSKDNRTAWLIIAGIFAAMGFYVRQSALIVPLTVLGFLLIYHAGRLRDIVMCFGYFLIGYMSVLFVVLIYYTRFMRFEEFLMSGLNPFGFLALAGKKLFSSISIPFNSACDLSSQAPDVSYKKFNLYYKYVREAFKLHSFLLVGLGFSILTFSRQVLSGNKLQIKKHLDSHSLLYLWVLSLSFAYTYYYYTEAFYINYCREFLPPLVIIFAAWLCHAVPAFDRYETIERFVLGGLFVSAVLFFAIPYFKAIMEEGIMVCLFLALFTLFYFARDFESSTRRLAFWFFLAALIVMIVFSRQPPLTLFLSGIVPKLAIIGVIFVVPWALLRKRNRPTLKEYIKFMSLAIVLGAFVLSLVYSAKRLTISYDSVWSPGSLEITSAYLVNHTRSNDTVMSGSVIWELQALRRPFLGISHPLAFEYQISEKKRERLEAAIRAKPPEVIILDGYTEKTYFRHLPWLWDFLSSRYNMVRIAAPAKYPVKIYQQKSNDNL